MITPEIQKVMERWEQYRTVVLVQRDIPTNVSVYITKKLVSLGIVPIIVDENSSKTDLCEASECESEFFYLFNDNNLITLSVGEKKISFDYLSQDAEQTLGVFIKSIFEVREGSTFYDVPETLVYDSEKRMVSLGRSSGIPLIIVENGVEFLPSYITIDGSLYNQKLLQTVDGREYHLDDLPLLYNGFSILTKDYVLNLRDGKRQPSFGQPIFAWDNILIYADGQISDSSLNWKMKVSNTPVDFIYNDNNLYILDITNNLYLINLRTRKVNRLGFIESTGRLFNINGEILLVTAVEVFRLTENGILKVDNFSTYHKQMYTSDYVYPTVCNLQFYKSGYFYGNTFLGNNILFAYISKDILTILTDVGTWKIKLKK